MSRDYAAIGLRSILAGFPERERFDSIEVEAAACIDMLANRCKSMQAALDRQASQLHEAQRVANYAEASMKASGQHGNLEKRREAERRAQKAEGQYVRLENNVRKLQHLARRNGANAAEIVARLLGIYPRAPENPNLVETSGPRPGASWIFKGGGCASCGYPVVVTQGQERYTDYAWYCSNPGCVKHFPVENTGDMQRPEWVVTAKPEARRHRDVAYTIGHAETYDRALAKGPVTKQGLCDSYEGGWVWPSVAEALDFLRSPDGLIEKFEAEPAEYAVYELALAGDWAVDVTKEPASDGVYRLLKSARIIRKIEEPDLYVYCVGCRSGLRNGELARSVGWLYANGPDGNPRWICPTCRDRSKGSKS